MTIQDIGRFTEDSSRRSATHKASSAPDALSVLIVDDDKTNRLILSTLIKKLNYTILTAVNGEDAVAVFSQERPDIVLMDVMMPVMNGYDSAVEIKRICGDTFVPIIFLTAITDENALAKCIEYGGDDFVTKPYNSVIIKAKIDAMVRVRELYINLSESRSKIQEHHNRLQLEHEIAEKIFTNITNPKSLDIDNINYFLRPMSITSGDILLCSRTPSGGMHVMLGDFTGHGLSAAIGAIPVSDTFYNLSSKGYSIGDIVFGINKKLRKTLPTGFFCAASLIEIDAEFKTMAIWNGGNPDIIITSKGKELVKIPPNHLPLGVVENESLDRSVEFIELSAGSKIYMISDGVVEAQNPQGEMYTQERFDFSLRSACDEQASFAYIRSSIDAHCAHTEQTDDITLIELTASPLDSNHEEKGHDKELVISPGKWALSIRLEADALRNTNPCPLITQSIMEIQGLSEHRERIYTILSELFSNSLEHGLLRLSSSIKNNPQGFIEYYNTRESALSNLTDSHILINIGHIPTPSGGELTITLEDSSAGFKNSNDVKSFTGNTSAHGRGIGLVKSLCSSLEYTNNGKKVIARYIWSAP